MSQSGTAAYAGVPLPSAPPLQEVEGWTSDQWAPPTSAPSEQQINAFAAGPGMLPDHPIGEYFVPMTMNIPEEHCLMPNSISPAMKEPSRCQHDLRGLTNPEIVGCDPLLNTSAEEITRFFLTHLKRPTLFVQVEGWHVVVRHHRNSKGRSSTSHHRVTDFAFKIDITSIIREQWNFITAHPNTWGHTISNYVNSGYIIKKLQMHMKVEWDWQNLQQSLTALVRSTGYNSKVLVSFPQAYSTISVMYDNCLTRTANNDAVKCFCVVSCLWIVGWPLKWALGYNDDSSLTAYYSMLGPWNEFYIRNAQQIFHNVCQRTTGFAALPLM